MKLFAFLLILIAVPSAFALQFLSPAEGETYAGTTAVTFVWDAENVTFSLGSTVQEINGTNTTVTLQPGMHTATITKDNATATRTVVISNPPSQSITITTDKQQYEAGESSRIRLAVTVPGQLNLTIQRNNQLVDAYTVNVQQQTDFLYPLTATGTYSVLVTGQGTSATAAFTVVNTTLGVTISGSSTATAGRLTTFTSVVSGGTPPYTYFWQFSDNTTSTQTNADHVFALAGNYTASLLVQDTGSRQASATTAITVTPEVYDLEITVMTHERKLIKGATVAISGPGGGETEISDSFGEAVFRNLAAGNFTVNVTYNHSNATYANTTTVALAEDESITLALGLPVEEAPASTAPAASTTSAPAEAEPVADAAPAALAAEEAAVAEKKAAEEALEGHRAAARAKLKGYQEGIIRSEEKRLILEQLDLLPLYDEATSAIAAAQGEAELSAILTDVPQEVTVLSKDTLVESFEQQDIESAVDSYLADTGIESKKEQQEYRYNIGLALEETSFTLKRTVVRVAIPSSSTPTVYTIFARTIQAPEGAMFVEYLPEGVSADDIRSDDVFTRVSDTAVMFTAPSYTYVTVGEAAQQEAIFAVPEELVPVPRLLGLVTVKLQPGSFTRGPLYAVILGILLCAGIAGNVLARRKPSATEPFTELAELTISLFEQGNHAAALKYVREIETVHSTLPQKDQKETADILSFIQETAAVHTFRSSAEHVATIVEVNDHAALPAAYERLVQHYEALPPARQQQEQERFEEAQSTLEQHLAMQEGQQA